MKTNSQILLVAFIGAFALLVPCRLAAGGTVAISGTVNAAGNPSGVSPTNGLAGASSLAGKTITNPAPATIPDGSTIFEIANDGTIYFSPPTTGAIQYPYSSASVYIANLTLGSFTVQAGTTGLTMSSDPYQQISPEFFHLPQEPAVEIPSELLVAMVAFNGPLAREAASILRSRMTAEEKTKAEDFDKLLGDLALLYKETDAHDATEVVPVVGDLGGPVDEWM